MKYVKTVLIMRKMATFHKLYDGSVLRLMSAKELIRIPVWQGNRILDTEHVSEIQRAISTDIRKLDFGYRIVSYMDTDASGRALKQYALIDGQHRAAYCDKLWIRSCAIQISLLLCLRKRLNPNTTL
jgi:hypothetical protein